MITIPRAVLAALLLAATVATASPGPRVDGSPFATILCYHIVGSTEESRFGITRETFRQHMRYLAMTGYNVIPLRHLQEYVEGKRRSIPRNAVVITIDDGWRSTYTEVFPEMQQRRFPFTVFVYPKIIGQTSVALSWKQVREMADAGVDIQSHSLSHPFLTRRRSSLDAQKYAEWLRHELRESKRILEAQTGRTVSFLAYPYGDYDSTVASTAASSGYTASVTCDFGRVTRGSDPHRMKRVIIDKKMDFAAFRRYLGAGSMQLAEVIPPPGQVLEPEQPLVISAKIPNHKSIDPKSVGVALVSAGMIVPYSYDAREGSIQLVLRDTLESVKGTYHRALIWATDLKTGKRVEASWTFRLGLPEALPAGVAAPLPAAAQPTAFGGGGGGRASQASPVAAGAAGAPQRAPR